MKGKWRVTGLALVLYLFSAALAAQTPSTGGESCSQSADVNPRILSGGGSVSGYRVNQDLLKWLLGFGASYIRCILRQSQL